MTMLSATLVLALTRISIENLFCLAADKGPRKCKIDITEQEPEPIVVSAADYKFLYPKPKQDSVILKTGEDIIISCPGTELVTDHEELGRTITATCESESEFTFNKTLIVYFDEVYCLTLPKHAARYTGESCENDGKEIEIGFLLTKTKFARSMRICFDDKKKIALYSEFELTRSIADRELDVPRQRFIEDSFYKFDGTVDDLYKRTKQRETINHLLGLPKGSKKYIQDASNKYLARGHLTAKVDYVYAPQQQATFHFCNVAPQWQSFNAANWKILERDVRNYADDNRLDLKVYTGTYGITTLPHKKTGKDVPLYLYVDGGGNAALPVPKLFWKVVYDPESKLGVVFLGINNPYQQDVTRSIICDDIVSEIEWLTWNPSNLEAGYGYACAVDDFREAVSYLPKFKTKGLLR